MTLHLMRIAYWANRLILAYLIIATYCLGAVSLWTRLAPTRTTIDWGWFHGLCFAVMLQLTHWIANKPPSDDDGGFSFS